MLAHTRQCFNAYLNQVAKLNHLDNPTQKFDVLPSVQQTLEKRIQESSQFLSMVNVVGVKEHEGEKLGLGIGSPIASTTDTNKQARQTSSPITLDSHRYRTEQTNFDTHMSYQLLDMWAGQDNFQVFVRDAILKRQAIDRLMIGFNGVERVPTSNRKVNCLLEDINIGWLQQYRNQAPERVLSKGKRGGSIFVGGPNADYANLRAVVCDALTLIDPWCRRGTGLVVICSGELLHGEYFPLVNTDHKPTDMLALDVILHKKQIDCLPVVQAPYFPPRSLLITRLDNLSLYWQIGARRRTLVDNAKQDRFENYESTNDAYVVEDFGAGCLVDNLSLSEDFSDEQTTPEAHAA